MAYTFDSLLETAFEYSLFNYGYPRMTVRNCTTTIPMAGAKITQINRAGSITWQSITEGSDLTASTMTPATTSLETNVVGGFETVRDGELNSMRWDMAVGLANEGLRKLVSTENALVTALYASCSATISGTGSSTILTIADISNAANQIRANDGDVGGLGLLVHPSAWDSVEGASTFLVSSYGTAADNVINNRQPSGWVTNIFGVDIYLCSDVVYTGGYYQNMLFDKTAVAFGITRDPYVEIIRDVGTSKISTLEQVGAAMPWTSRARLIVSA